MDLKDIARIYNISLQRLQHYEAAGFLRKQGQHAYQKVDIDQLGLLEVLTQAGFGMEELKRYLEASRGGGANEQIQLLLDKRREILSKLHVNQTLLAHIDFLIWSTKKEESKNG